MAIELVRIDDRLIHGQVATTWINDFQIEQVLIIDDRMATDEIQKKVMLMTAPSNIKVSFFSVDRFNEILGSNPIKRRTLLLYTNPIDVLRNIEGNLEISVLNVGNIRFREGRKQFAPSVSLTEEEREAFVQLLEKGLDINWQMVPREKAVPIREILEKT